MAESSAHVRIRSPKAPSLPIISALSYVAKSTVCLASACACSAEGDVTCTRYQAIASEMTWYIAHSMHALKIRVQARPGVAMMKKL